jgi:hypothetical protein
MREINDAQISSKEPHGTTQTTPFTLEVSESGLIECAQPCWCGRFQSQRSKSEIPQSGRQQTVRGTSTRAHLASP